MTKFQLQQLKVGTLIYNGRTEAVIKMDGNTKCIEVMIPIDSMSNASNDFNEQPEWWDVIEE